MTIKVSKLVVSPINYRKTDLGEEEMQQLMDTISRNGLKQPMRAKKNGKEAYEVYVGGRRLEAIKRLKMKDVPDDWVIVDDPSTEEMITAALIENIQREDPHYLDTAEGIQRLWDEWTDGKPTQTKLAGVIAKSQNWTKDMIGISKLRLEVKKTAAVKNIKFRIMQSYVVPLRDDQKQLLFIDQIDKQNLSNNQIKKLYEEFSETDTTDLWIKYGDLPVPTWDVYNQSSANMDHLENDSVHLIVTSPPYADAKDYEAGDGEVGGSGEAYMELLRPVFEECYRVLAPGRTMCLNIADLPISNANGYVRWNELASQVRDLALEVGFERRDVIIWNKPARTIPQKTSSSPNAVPIVNSIEYIWILRKMGKTSYDHVPEHIKRLSKMSDDELSTWTRSVWDIAPQHKINSKGDIYFDHLAPFPEELVRRCVGLYSYITETVVDPFAGSGTTLKVSHAEARNSVGYELKAEYCELIRERLDE